jgi:glycosyltransferase involved in cell wall biosynthesis
MKKRPLVSFIIPTLQEEKYIRKTLSNIISGVKDVSYEIIVSDGGSTDRTEKIAKQRKVIFIGNRTNKKQTIAIGRNVGAARARGKYLIFLDSDCSIKNINSFVNKTISLFEKRNLVALTTKIRVSPKHETLSAYLVYLYLNNLHRIACNWIHRGLAAGEFQMYDRKSFFKVKGYRENLPVGEDYDIFLRISRIGRVRFEPSLTVFHTGRRAAKVGWAKLVWSWSINFLARIFLNRSYDSEWKVIR